MPNSSIASKMLQASSSAISAYASVRLLEKKPELKERFGQQAFEYWKDFITELTKDLAVAVNEDNSELFCAKVNWEREAFQARGLSDEHVADALNALSEVVQEELPAPMSKPSLVIIEIATKSFEQPSAANPEMEAKDPVSRLAASYLLKVLEGDSHGGIDLVVSAFQSEMALEDAYAALTVAQTEVGRMWHVAEISIAEEHLITHTTHRAMSVLNYQAKRAERNGKTIVSSAVEGNYHDLGVRAVTDFFEFDGWRVICLGHNTPPDEIAQAANVFDASLVMLSASMGSHIEATRKTINLVKQNKSDCKILLGGKIFSDFPNLGSELGADACAQGIRDAVAEANRLFDVQ